MFTTCVAFYTVLCLIGICLISRNPKYVQKQPQTKDKSDEPVEDTLTKKEEDNDVITPNEAFSSWRFYFLGLLLF